MKLKEGSIIYIQKDVWPSISARGHHGGYWLILGAWDSPFCNWKDKETGKAPQSYRVIRCTKTGKGFKYENGFAVSRIDKMIDEGTIIIIKQ